MGCKLTLLDCLKSEKNVLWKSSIRGCHRRSTTPHTLYFPLMGRCSIRSGIFLTREENDRTLYHATTKMDNQPIERYHATYRERDKVIRGLKSEKTANQYVENWRIFYNFIRPHMFFNGLTPSEVAGINIGADKNR